MLANSSGPGALSLALGGIRSGKSEFAETLAASAGRALYVATGTAFDDDLAHRIARHRRRRPPDWTTLEAPTDLAASIDATWSGEAAALVDDVGMLATNHLLRLDAAKQANAAKAGEAVRAALDREIDGLLEWRARRAGVALIIVSSEVGLGLVSPTPLGRAFQDALGAANRRLAGVADHVYLVVAGWAVDLRQIGHRVSDDESR